MDTNVLEELSFLIPTVDTCMHLKFAYVINPKFEDAIDWTCAMYMIDMVYIYIRLID